MIHRYLLVWVLLIPINNLAQDIGLDGGLPVDSTYVDKLIDEAFSTRDKEPERASNLYHTAMVKAREIGYRKGLVKALDHLGILNGIGGRYDKAIEFFEEGLRINMEANDHEGIGVSYNNLGIIYKRQGRYAEGYQVYLQSVKEFEISGKIDRLANVYYDIAAIHTQMDEWNQALYYNRKVLSIKDSLGDQIGIMMAVGGIADFYYHLGNYDSAYHFYKEFERLVDLHGKPTNQMTVQISLGKLDLVTGNYGLAYERLLRAEQLALQVNRKQELARIYNFLAETCIRMQQDSRALEYARKSMAMAPAIGSFELWSETCRVNALALERNGLYPEALEAQRLYSVYMDSMFHIKKVLQYEFQKVQLEVFQKDRVLAEQQLEMQFLEGRNRQATILTWTLAGASVLLVGFLVMLFLRSRTRNRMNKVLHEKNHLISNQKKEIQQVNVELEKRMLRAQMNPHFIFNALNSIQHLISVNEKESALKYLTKFSSLLRQVLESSMSVNILLSEEIKLISIYIELEALRFDHSFSYSITHDNIDVDAYEVPILLVQPYVENAIHHGLMPKADDRKLSINFSKEDNFIICEIVDNGIGRKAAEARNRSSTHQSRGMSVTRKRLEILAKSHDIKAKVNITDCVFADGTTGGTRVEIRIPV